MAGSTQRFQAGLVLAALLGLGAAAAAIWDTGRARPSPEPRAAPAARPAGAGAGIGALGLVEPSSEEIRVGTERPGTIEVVHVGAGSAVEKGAPLFVVESRPARAEVDRRRADVEAAQARLALALARLEGLAAAVTVARAGHAAALSDLAEAQDVVRIADELRTADAVSGRERTRRQNALKAAGARAAEAAARVAQAEAELALSSTEKGGALVRAEEAAVAQARAALSAAETELLLRTVRAPVGGTVLHVNLRPGEFAQSGGGGPPLMILGRLDPLHVRVEIEEAAIPRFDPGSSATASRRGEGREVIALRHVRTEPLVVPKRTLAGSGFERADTRVLQVIYAVEAPHPPLHPGQVLDVFVREADPVREAGVTDGR